jgi:hypothetical protein
MSAPTPPTAATIVSEALSKAGESSPSSALTTRGNLWLEEIKNDIALRTKTLKSLQKTRGLVFNKGQSTYSMPSDFAGQGEISISILDGSNTGVLQTATSTTATLASSFSATEDFMIGKEILITSGTGVYQISQVTGWDNSTKIATVVAWGTTPAALDGYLVIETYRDLRQGPVWNYDRNLYTMIKQKPFEFFPTGDVDYGEFILDCPPDKAYGGMIRYYVDIMTVDLASTLISTIYQKYRNVWIQGVYARRLQDIDDDRAPKEMQSYYNLLQVMIASETFGNALSELQARVSD